jgi:hypothetical protein
VPKWGLKLGLFLLQVWDMKLKLQWECMNYGSEKVYIQVLVNFDLERVSQYPTVMAFADI